MKISKLTVRNDRSIKEVCDLRIEPLQAFVGANDAGKSNILRAVEAFLGASAAGVTCDDFNDPAQPIVIEAEFTALSDEERKRLRTYLIGGCLILRKEFVCGIDPKSSKPKISTEYHGYMAEPKDVHLSIKKIADVHGARPKWAEIAAANGLTAFVTSGDGKVTKDSYQKGIERFLYENEVEYDDPVLGETQALGLQQNLLTTLPELYLLPAITNYSDEIDSRSTTTTFRRLMSDLSDRYISSDPRYAEIAAHLDKLRVLLNKLEDGTGSERLESLGVIEDKILRTVQRLMPTVEAVHLGVTVEEPKNLFAKGVNLRIHDGVLTDVVDKGHGMQRCLIFSLLQLLMDSAREKRAGRSIILAIEEPELYIHPHSQRLIYRVLKEFAGVRDEEENIGNDQVIYTTHANAFVDIGHYEMIGCVCKKDTSVGTKVSQCEIGALATGSERKDFKLLTSFSLHHNEVFFSRHVALVEGPDDEIAIIASARKLGIVEELLDERGISVAVTYGKETMPKFQKILNAFGISYTVLLEMDGKPREDASNKNILDLVQTAPVAEIADKLEDVVGVGKDHFRDVFEAKKFFSDPANIPTALEDIVKILIPENLRQTREPLVSSA